MYQINWIICAQIIKSLKQTAILHRLSKHYDEINKSI
jgi:hypothetical protein